MDHVSKSFPQRFPPAPPSQPSSLRSEGFLNQDLDLRRKRKIVKSTGLVAGRWVPWHCNAMEQIGPDKYLEIADIALRSREPKTLFSWMLKQELEDLLK